MKSITKRFSILSIFTFLFTLSMTSMCFANDIESKIDQWGNSALSIGIKLLRWGGIFSLMGIGFFLYFNKDEQGAKRGKLSFMIVIVATFIAWFAPLIYDQFVK